MKNIFLIITSVFLVVNSFAQAPERMTYQAVVRNISNQLISNSPIGMKTSVLQGSSTGSVVYSETHTTTTNINGLATILIGNGNLVSGNFSTIDWGNGPFFLKTETDPSGGTTYSIAGTTQFLSVPYALYAETSGSSIPGPQGIQGPAGPQGQIGLTGAQGPTGSTGATGPQGIPGSQDAWSLTGNSGTNSNTNFIGTTDAQDWVVRTNNTERFRLTSAGNLGIGLTNPLAALTVRNSINTPNSIVSDIGNSIFDGGFRLVSLKGESTNNPGDAVLKFGMVYGASNFTSSSLIRFHRGTAANDGSISFSTNNDAVEIMRLANVANVGRVGIGTSTPAATLDINGSLKISNGSQGTGKVLTSDATGNATWQSPSGANKIVTGTTTAGFAPSTLNGSGFTVTRVNTGNYSVVFSIPFTTVPSVNATVFLSNGAYLFEMQLVKVSGVTTNGFTVHTLNSTGGSSMNVIDYLPFSFIAVGN